jgi:hypothetical protein
VRLLGKDFPDERIVQKILVTMPKKYRSKIYLLEELKDLTSISLGELVNALQAQKQRRLMRHEKSVQGAFQARALHSGGGKDKRFNKKKMAENDKEACKTAIFKVEIENGDYILVKGKGIVAIDSLPILN